MEIRKLIIKVHHTKSKNFYFQGPWETLLASSNIDSGLCSILEGGLSNSQFNGKVDRSICSVSIYCF
jgi:hypothetical protein